MSEEQAVQQDRDEDDVVDAEHDLHDGEAHESGQSLGREQDARIEGHGGSWTSALAELGGDARHEVLDGDVGDAREVVRDRASVRL